MSLKDVERSRRETGIPNPAATALLRMPAPTVRASLEHESEELRVLFLSHVGAAPDAALHGEAMDEIAVGLLPGLLDSENPPMGEAAKRALAKALHGNSKDASAAAFRILHQRVEGADLPTRLESVMALGRPEGSLGCVFAIPPAAEEFVRSTVMEAITESQDAEARRSAAELFPHLKIFRDAAPVSDLIKLLNVDDLPKVRAGAVEMLAGRGAAAKPAVPALIQLLKVPEHSLLTGVLLALEKIGLSEPGVLDALMALAAGSDEGTCAVLRNLIMRQRSVLFNKRESADVLGRLYQAVIANNRLSADFRGNWGSETLHMRGLILNSKR